MKSSNYAVNVRTSPCGISLSTIIPLTLRHAPHNKGGSMTPHSTRLLSPRPHLLSIANLLQIVGLAFGHPIRCMTKAL